MGSRTLVTTGLLAGSIIAVLTCLVWLVAHLSEHSAAHPTTGPRPIDQQDILRAAAQRLTATDPVLIVLTRAQKLPLTQELVIAEIRNARHETKDLDNALRQARGAIVGRALNRAAAASDARVTLLLRAERRLLLQSSKPEECAAAAQGYALGTSAAERLASTDFARALSSALDEGNKPKSAGKATADGDLQPTPSELGFLTPIRLTTSDPTLVCSTVRHLLDDLEQNPSERAIRLGRLYLLLHIDRK